MGVMPEALVPHLGVAALAGIALGVAYFGGLWLTVRNIQSSRRPHLRMLSSFAMRMAMLMAGLVAVADGRWQALLAGFAGVMLARGWWRLRSRTLAVST